jgi:hypothetical protein
VWVGLLSYAREFLQWLGIHAQALQTLGVLAGVVVTLAGVIVALYYARLTRDLARSTRDQARTTREMFEAGNRPYLEPTFLFDELRYYRPEDYHLVFSLHNHGTVPAALVGWRMNATLDGEEVVVTLMDDQDLAVFPGENRPIANRKISGQPLGQEPPGRLRLDVVVEYRSLRGGPSRYRTLIIAKREQVPGGTQWMFTMEAR